MELVAVWISPLNLAVPRALRLRPPHVVRSRSMLGWCGSCCMCVGIVCPSCWPAFGVGCIPVSRRWRASCVCVAATSRWFPGPAPCVGRHGRNLAKGANVASRVSFFQYPHHINDAKIDRKAGRRAIGRLFAGRMTAPH